MRYHRTVLTALAGLALGACSDRSPTELAPDSGKLDAPGLAAYRAASGKAIEGSYIVVLKEGADPRSVAAVAGVGPKYVYEAALNGFAAELNQGQLNALRKNPNVEYVEEDQVVQADGSQSNAVWGLDRINQRYRPLDGEYTWGYTGYGVRAYIIDTGLDRDHAQFGSRAMNVYDAFGGNGNDCNGHGTHVGGTVGGKTYGVAKRVRLRGVRVLDCNGSGSTSGVIAGVDWVRKNAIKPAIANMSLGGGYSSSMNSAVRNLSNSGVFVSVAAGNNYGADACNYSPASAGRNHPVMTTAASTSTDYRANFSNVGSCVDIFAPGKDIKSAWIGSGTTETRTISGTSMAAPHVAGVAALVKHKLGDVSSGTVQNRIRNAATSGQIKNKGTNSPNLLLYKYRTSW